ncbi:MULTISPECIES: formyltetrahydrofolate deformylase [unclassified Brachybacterium]|uniref:formyltetrahydrofolate deformylase n=1 Tax=unclassified Brachybacterium TaxID=2623841 RepID=UPI00360D0AA5
MSSPIPAHHTVPTREYVLTFVCEDRPGIVHAVTGAIVEVRGNITESRQFESGATRRFYMRLQIATNASADEIRAAMAPVADRFGIEYSIDSVGRPVRTLILGSTAKHCLNDLLFQIDAGHLPIDPKLVLANHATLEPLSQFYEVPFEHLATKDAAEKTAFEDRVREVVAEHDIELVVLARYMQILSPELCAELSGRCINIHHSFLPGFKGANPYRQAYARGVKQIGATAHFVTSDLDEGPIIEQDVIRVDHTRSPQELMAIGQDAEVRTLRQAVTWFAQSRVLLDGNRTVIFR